MIAISTRQRLPRMALIGFSFLALLTAVYFLQASPSDAAGSANPVIYDDSLHWSNWSWNTKINPDATSPVLFGSESLAVTYKKAWAGLSFHKSNFDTSPYTHLQFALRPAGASLPRVWVALHDTDDKPIKWVKLSAYATANPNGWYRIFIPLADLGGRGKISRVTLQDGSGSAQPTFHLDNIEFISPGPRR